MNFLLEEALPSPWVYCTTSDGRIFFLNEELKESTWLHPVKNLPLQSGFLYSSELPSGWELQISDDRIVYFIDHINKKTYLEPPEQEEPNKILRDSKRSTGDFQRSSSRRKSLKQKAPIIKRNRQELVIKRNWLYRQEGRALKMWKKRWCLLSEFCLFIYKGPEEGETLASILLPSYTIRNCTQLSGSKRWILKIEHENMKSMSLASDDSNDFKDWFEKLTIATQGQIPLDISSSGTNLTTTKSEPNIPLSLRQNYDENSFNEPNAKYAFDSDSKPKLKTSKSYQYDDVDFNSYNNVASFNNDANFNEGVNYNNDGSFENGVSFDNGDGNFTLSSYPNNLNMGMNERVDQLKNVGGFFKEINEHNFRSEIKNGARDFEMPGKQEINHRLKNTENDFNELLKNAQSSNFFQNKSGFDLDPERNIALDINRNLECGEVFNIDPRLGNNNEDFQNNFNLESRGNLDSNGYLNSSKNYNIDPSINLDSRLNSTENLGADISSRPTYANEKFDPNRVINSGQDLNFSVDNNPYSVVHKIKSIQNNFDLSTNYADNRSEVSGAQPPLPPKLFPKSSFYPEVLPPKIDPMKRVEEWTKQADMNYEPNTEERKIDAPGYLNDRSQLSKLDYADPERSGRLPIESDYLRVNQDFKSTGPMNAYLNADMNKSEPKVNYDGKSETGLETHPDFAKSNFSDMKLLENSINPSESASQVHFLERESIFQKGRGEMKGVLPGRFVSIKSTESEVGIGSKGDTNKADDIIDMLIRLRKNENSLQETYYRIFGQICRQDQNSSENDVLKSELKQNEDQLMNINQAIKNLEAVLKSFGRSAEGSSKSDTNSKVEISNLSLTERNDVPQSYRDANLISNITNVEMNNGHSNIYGSNDESLNKNSEMIKNGLQFKINNQMANEGDRYFKEDIGNSLSNVPRKTQNLNSCNYHYNEFNQPLKNVDTKSNYFKDIIKNYPSKDDNKITSNNVINSSANTHSQNVFYNETIDKSSNHDLSFHPKLGNIDLNNRIDNDKFSNIEINYSYPHKHVNDNQSLNSTTNSKIFQNNAHITSNSSDYMAQADQKNNSYDINQNKYIPNASNYNFNNYQNRKHSEAVNNKQADRINIAHFNKATDQYADVELRVKNKQPTDAIDIVPNNKNDVDQYKQDKPFNNSINAPLSHYIADFNKQKEYNDRNNDGYKQIRGQNIGVKEHSSTNVGHYDLGFDHKLETDKHVNYNPNFDFKTDPSLRDNSGRMYDHVKVDLDNKYCLNLDKNYLGQNKFENSINTYGKEYTHKNDLNFGNISNGNFTVATSGSSQSKTFTNLDYYHDSAKRNDLNKITNLNDHNLYKTVNENHRLNKFGTQSEYLNYPKSNLGSRNIHSNIYDASNNFSNDGNKIVEKIDLLSKNSNAGLQYNAGRYKEEDKTVVKDENTIRRLSGFYTPRPFQKTESLENKNYSKINIQEKLVGRESDGFEEKYDIDSILTHPKKITIDRSENYGETADSDPEDQILDETQLQLRRQKSDRLKKIVAAQSLQDFSNGELTRKYGETKDRVNDEIQRRQELLNLRQDLAYQASRVRR